MNIRVKLLNPVSNCTRIRNCIEDYTASIFPFDLQIGWAVGKINYRHPDKPEDGSTGYIAFDVSGKDRVKLKTARYLTRKCKLNTDVSLNDEQIRILAEKINSLLWTDDELNSIKLIRGNAITEAYEDEIGGSSCMTGCNSDCTGLYASNPTRFEMLIIRSNNDSARAIIHKLDDGRKLFGLVYTTAEHLLNKMRDYAIKQKWVLCGDPDNRNSWIMSDLNYCDGEIPYMDVLTSGEINGDLLTVSCNFGSFELQNQDGSLDNSCQCENCGDHVHENNVYNDNEGNNYCEYCFSENFICCPHCDEMAHNNDAVFIQGKEIYTCQYCADNHYYKCETCNDYFELDGILILDNDTYCIDCFGEVAGHCENCGEAFYTENLISINNGLLCADCATERQKCKGTKS